MKSNLHHRSVKLEIIIDTVESMYSILIYLEKIFLKFNSRIGKEDSCNCSTSRHYEYSSFSI